MAYSTTLDQKRRETLRRQLYGKEVITPKRKAGSVKREDNQSHSTFSYTNTPDSDISSTNSQLLTTNFLTRDLAKILIFSTIAVAAQLTLFFAINNHLVKLPI